MTSFIKVGASIYVRTMWDDASDKVTRVIVNGTSPVDFAGDRLIPIDTPHTTLIVSRYHTASGPSVLRGGSDEAPPVRINNAYLGGNHGGVLDYSVSITDAFGNPVSDLVVTQGRLVVVESYRILEWATVTIERRFGSDGLCAFHHRVDPMQAYAAGFHSGVQAMPPLALPGEQRVMWTNGTNPEPLQATAVTAWASPTVPHRTYVEVGARIGWASIMDARPASVILTPVFVSGALKIYPRSFEAWTAKPGTPIETTGRFGVYNPSARPE